MLPGGWTRSVTRTGEPVLSASVLNEPEHPTGFRADDLIPGRQVRHHWADDHARLRCARRGAGLDRGDVGPGTSSCRVAHLARGLGLGGSVVARRLLRAGIDARGRRDRGGGADPGGRRRSSGRRRHRAGRADDPRPRIARAEGSAAAPHRHRRGHVVPAVQRAGQRIRPRRAHHPGRPRRRRVGRQRPEGVEHQRPPRRARPAAGSHELGRDQARRHHVLRDPDAAAGRRGATAAPDERPRLVQRGVLQRGARCLPTT